MKKTLSLATAGLLALSLCTACQSTPSYKEYSSFSYFNTVTSWVYDEGEASAETASALWGKLKEKMGEVEYSLSTQTDGSIARFNRAKAGERVEIDGIAYEALTRAQDIYTRTEGAYNPAVGLLVDLWGFSPRFSGEYSPQEPYDRAREGGALSLPEQRYISAFSSPSVTDFSAVELTEDGGKYFATKPENAAVCVDGREYTMRLNLGGAGKGYAVDEAQKLLDGAGLSYGYFNLGGSSMRVFKDARQEGQGEWSISVRNPRSEALEGSAYCVVSGANLSLSSSGDYENYYELEGKRYCHIIDAASGYPVNSQAKSGIVCASVFGLSALEGDAITTALIVMGKERAIEFARTQLRGEQAVFVYYDGERGEYEAYTTAELSSVSPSLRVNQINEMG